MMMATTTVMDTDMEMMMMKTNHPNKRKVARREPKAVPQVEQQVQLVSKNASNNELTSVFNLYIEHKHLYMIYFTAK
jgi:hypothetical protein